MNIEQQKLNQLLPFVNTTWIKKRTKNWSREDEEWRERLYALVNAYKATHGRLTLVDYLKLRDIEAVQCLAHGSASIMKYISNVPHYRYRPYSNGEIPDGSYEQWGYVVMQLPTLLYNSIHPNKDISFEQWLSEINKPLQ